MPVTLAPCCGFQSTTIHGHSLSYQEVLDGVFTCVDLKILLGMQCTKTSRGMAGQGLGRWAFQECFEMWVLREAGREEMSLDLDW